MPIGNAPINESIAGGVVSPVWANWFAKIVTALKGWRETRYLTIDVTFGNVNADSDTVTNASVPGVKFGDVPLIGPQHGYLTGTFYSAYVSADDIVTFRWHNFSPVGPLSGHTETFYLITFRQ